MGVTTNAILFYGFIQTEEGEGKWEEAYDKVMDDKVMDDFDLFFHHEEKTGFVFGTHQSGDYPLYYLGIASTHTVARRGYPQPISTIEVNPDWERQLREYAASIKIDVSNLQAGWYLASYWG